VSERAGEAEAEEQVDLLVFVAAKLVQVLPKGHWLYQSLHKQMVVGPSLQADCQYP